MLCGGYLAIKSEFLSPADGWGLLSELSPHSRGSDVGAETWTSIKQQVIAAQQHAHDNATITLPGTTEALQTVHGDSRLNNIVTRRVPGGKREFRWIDFDWAGIHDRSLYPAFINMLIAWGTGVGPGQEMNQQHDKDTLENQLMGKL